MIYLILSALIILIPITYFYFKFVRTQPTNFFLFVILQLTVVTSLFYAIPIRKILFVKILEMDLPTASPSIFVYIAFIVSLIAITYLFVKYEAQKAAKIIDKQTDIAGLKDSSVEEAEEPDDVLSANYKMRKPPKLISID